MSTFEQELKALLDKHPGHELAVHIKGLLAGKQPPNVKPDDIPPPTSGGTLGTN